MIFDNAFRQNTQLKTLLLIGNSLLYIAQTAFDGPVALQHLFLQQTSISEISFIPMRNLQTLETLSFGNNFITSLTLPDNFPVKKLRVLDLQSNSIMKIHVRDIEALKQSNDLRLVLRGNDIDYIEHNSFNSSKLHTLDLSANPNNLSAILGGLNGLTTKIVRLGQFGDTDTDFDINPFTLNGLCNVSVREVNLQYSTFSLLSNATFSCLIKLQKLDLSQTHIGFLPVLNSPLSLTELVLNRNLFTSICNIIPRNFPVLQSLQMNSNELIQFEDSCLKNLTKLQYLDLSNSFCASVTCCKSQFSGLFSLRFLNFSYLSSQFLSDTAFPESEKLEVLDFAHTQIIASGSLGPFNNLKLLRFLNLSYTSVNTSNQNLLNGLEGLIYLNLERSFFHLGVIPNNNLFLQAPNLQVLILAFCNLTTIEDQAFHNLEKLTYVDLSHNKLIVFSSHAFADLSHIHLNFAFNNISAVPLNLVNHISGTSIINLSHNPLDCSCHNIDFLTWYKEKERLFEERKSTCCGSPKSSEGQTLSTLNISCNVPTAIIVVCVVVPVVVILCSIYAIKHRNRIYNAI